MTKFIHSQNIELLPAGIPGLPERLNRLEVSSASGRVSPSVKCTHLERNPDAPYSSHPDAYKQESSEYRLVHRETGKEADGSDLVVPILDVPGMPRHITAFDLLVQNEAFALIRCEFMVPVEMMAAIQQAWKPFFEKFELIKSTAP